MDTNLGSFINSRIRVLGKTRRQLERESGVSRTAIGNIESGITKNPRMTTLEKLAKYLHCTVDELIERLRTKPREIRRKTLDVTGLTEDQERIIFHLVEEFKREPKLQES